jgi:hypothetical protein
MPAGTRPAQRTMLNAEVQVSGLIAQACSGQSCDEGPAAGSATWAKSIATTPGTSTVNGTEARRVTSEVQKRALIDPQSSRTKLTAPAGFSRTLYMRETTNP